MTRTLKIPFLFFILFFTSILLQPSFIAVAQVDDERCSRPVVPADCEDEDQYVPEIPPWPQEVLKNPLKVDNLNNFIANVLSALIKIALPIIVLFLVYSGMRLVMARGNKEELASAKKNLLWVIIGVAIVLGSWTIVRVLKGTLDQIDISGIINIINYFV